MSVWLRFAERNPDFRKEALETLPKNKTICVLCSLGGTMLVGTKPREMSGKVFKTDPDRAFGRESRSLKACYELYEVSTHCIALMWRLQCMSMHQQLALIIVVPICACCM